MIGDIADMQARLKRVLPARWFGDVTPILDGLLAGLGSSWADLFTLLNIVRQQSRIKTATAQFLDGAGQDFFGDRLIRRAGEADLAYRARLLQALGRSRATRAAVIDAAAAAGGAAVVFEPGQPRDTGVYGGPGLGYGVAGGYGSLLMPFESLLVVTGGADVIAAVAEAMPASGVAWVRAG